MPGAGAVGVAGELAKMLRLTETFRGSPTMPSAFLRFIPTTPELTNPETMRDDDVVGLVPGVRLLRLSLKTAVARSKHSTGPTS